jgi:cation diffusion facilitator family transporter
MQSPSIVRYAWLSIAAALATMGLKTAAWWLTGSVGLLSDAIESLVNLAGGLMALAMLSIAARPADDDHAHGHGKAEYFSSAFEGLLIAIAAVSIGYAAVGRLLAPRPLESVGLGLAITVVASGINWGTARALLAASRAARSIALEADAHHLMTDVWTSAGVVVGVTLAWATGWWWLDPLIALGVGLNVLRVGWQLMHRSTAGLMDAALPADDLARIDGVLDTYRAHGLDFHAVRTRQAGARAFITLHVLVPGRWTVQEAHDWSERVESDLRRAVPHGHVTTHLEPIEDPVSQLDRELDRPDA